jgi:hypothetical protein
MHDTYVIIAFEWIVIESYLIHQARNLLIRPQAQGCCNSNSPLLTSNNYKTAQKVKQCDGVTKYSDELPQQRYSEKNYL